MDRQINMTMTERPSAATVAFRHAESGEYKHVVRPTDQQIQELAAEGWELDPAGFEVARDSFGKRPSVGG